jgi:hypothetical protein
VAGQPLGSEQLGGVVGPRFGPPVLRGRVDEVAGGVPQVAVVVEIRGWALDAG